MKLARIQEYYRQKRIRRILNFYSNLQSYGLFTLGPTPIDLKPKSKPVLISRDAIMHFVLTVALLGMIGSLLGGLVRPLVKILPSGNAPIVASMILAGLPTAFLAVEIADAILLKTTRVVDVIIDLILPIVVLIGILAFVVGVTKFNLGPEWAQKVSDWKDRTNENIQKKPRALPVDPASGNNWAFILNEQNQLLPLTRPEAHKACLDKGGDWQLFDADPKFQPDPVPTFARPLSVWLGDGQFPVTQIGGKTGFAKSGVYSSASLKDRAPTLCIRKAGP